MECYPHRFAALPTRAVFLAGALALAPIVLAVAVGSPAYFWGSLFALAGLGSAQTVELAVPLCVACRAASKRRGCLLPLILLLCLGPTSILGCIVSGALAQGSSDTVAVAGFAGGFALGAVLLLWAKTRLDRPRFEGFDERGHAVLSW